MSAFQQKFEVRVRRLLGVTDDSQPVSIETNTGDMGGCNTCGYGAQEPIELRCAGELKSYWDLGTLISDLDKVVV